MFDRTRSELSNRSNQCPTTDLCHDKRRLLTHNAGVDLDLALVRSFVVTAEKLNFGGAARQLQITQQALSQRIRRLETRLGVSLFMRDARNVTLTAAGQRFLPHAKHLLLTAEDAVQTLHQGASQLRIDVLDNRLASLRLTQRAMDARPEFAVEISMRRGLLAALAALERDEIDVTFGRVHGLGRPLPGQVSHTLARLEPMHALVGVDHPLAGHSVLRPAQLRETGIWAPNPGSAIEWDAYLGWFARDFGASLHFEPGASSLELLVQRVRAERVQVMLTGADMPLPGDSGLRAIPLVHPVPVYPWSVLWAQSARRLTVEFVGAVVAAGGVPRRQGGTPEIDAARQWLPEPDREALLAA